MDVKENRITLAKQIVQRFVDSRRCMTLTAVESLLERTNNEDILRFALDNGLKLSKKDAELMLNVIWNVKTFYGASPVGSTSVWKERSSPFMM